MFSFALVTTDNEALGVFVYAKRDWRPGGRVPVGRGLAVRPQDEPRGAWDARHAIPR